MSDPARCLQLGFAGTPEFAVPALNALASTRHELRAVFTQPDRPAGRGRKLQSSAVKLRAGALGLKVYQPVSCKLPEVRDIISELQLDALVVVAYGLILPPKVLTLPRLGCLNIHASLLPRWRGAAPIQRALLAGDSASGVTIMRMEEGLDTGPMLAARSIDMAPGETAKTLHDRLASLGSELLCETLDALVAGRGHETPQPVSGVTYAEKIAKSEALIDWQEDAVNILRRIRAFNPWPIAQTQLRGAPLRIWEAELGQTQVLGAAAAGTVLSASPAGIEVACGRGILRIARLQLPGRRALSAAEFLRATPLAGARFDTARRCEI